MDLGVVFQTGSSTKDTYQTQDQMTHAHTFQHHDTTWDINGIMIRLMHDIAAPIESDKHLCNEEDLHSRVQDLV